MTRTATPKLGAYAALAGAGLVAALVIGRPELVALAAPFALVLLAGLSLAEEPRVDGIFELTEVRQLQGETVEAELELRAEATVGHLQLLLDLPAASPPRRRTRCFCGSTATSAGSSTTRSAAATGAATSSATSSCGRRTPSGCSSTSGPSGGRVP